MVGRRVAFGKQTESQRRSESSPRASAEVRAAWTARVGEHPFSLLHGTRTRAAGIVHDAAVFGGLRAEPPIKSKWFQPIGHAVHHIFWEKRWRSLNVCENTAKLHQIALCLLLHAALLHTCLWLNIRAMRYPAPTTHPNFSNCRDTGARGTAPPSFQQTATPTPTSPTRLRRDQASSELYKHRRATTAFRSLWASHDNGRLWEWCRRG